MTRPAWISPTLPSVQVVTDVCDGDSITWGQTYANAQHTYPYLLGAQAGAPYGGTGASFINLGHSGDTIADMIARGSATDAAFDPASEQNILFIMGGTNDLISPANVGTVFAELGQYCAARLAAHGWLIVIHTLFDCLPRAPDFDAARQAYNALIRTQYMSLGAVAIVDCGASTEMGQSGPQQAANFGADGAHPNATGNQIFANYAQRPLKRLATYLLGTGGGGGGGSGPSVISVDPLIVSSAGGDVVTIEVDASAGCTGATVCGVALDPMTFTIVDPTHVRGTTQAMAASAIPGAVSVTNATGTGFLDEAIFCGDLSGVVGAWMGDRGVTSASGLASNVADQSGNGNDIAAVLTARPTVMAAGLNGLDYLSFDGVANVLRKLLVTTGTNEISWFAVLRATANATGYPGVLTYGVSSSGALILMTGTNTPSVVYRSGNLGGSGGGDLAAPTWHRLSAVFRSADTEETWTDGASPTPTAAGGAIPTSGVIEIGAYNGSNFSQIDVAEVWLFNKNKEAAGGRDVLEAYLQRKWGL